MLWLDFGLFTVMLLLLVYVFMNNTVTILHKVYLIFHACLMLWPLCQFAISTTQEPNYQLFYLKLAYVGLAILGFGWTVFSVFLTGQSYYLNRRSLTLLAIPTLLVVIAILVNPGQSFVSPVEGQYTDREYGILYWVMVAVLLCYVVFSLQIMIRTLRGDVAPRHRRQIRMAVAGMFILTGFAIADLTINVYLAEWLPVIPGLTSLGIVLSTYYFVVSIQRHRVFDIVRIAQVNIIDSMSTGIIVLDEHDVVLETNRVLRGLLDIRAGDRFVIETFLEALESEGSLQDFLDQYRMLPPVPASIEVRIVKDGTPHYLVVHGEPIIDKQQLIGRVLTFQDVSELRLLVDASHRQNDALQERNRALISMQDELYKVNQKLEQMAVTDSLTGCYNRRYLMQQLEHEVMTNVRYNIPFAIFLFDIDLFKSINDNYGHLIGDEVIRSTADVVKNSLRRTDILARYGGEEFTVYLPHTNREQAAMLAQRVKDVVENNRIASDYDNKGETVKVTISMGVLTVESNNGSRIDNPKTYLRDLFAKVDSALYEAKHGGRNRIVIADPVNE